MPIKRKLPAKMTVKKVEAKKAKPVEKQEQPAPQSESVPVPMEPVIETVVESAPEPSPKPPAQVQFTHTVVRS